MSMSKLLTIRESATFPWLSCWHHIDFVQVECAVWMKPWAQEKTNDRSFNHLWDGILTCLIAKLITRIAQPIIPRRQFINTLMSNVLWILGYNSIPCKTTHGSKHMKKSIFSHTSITNCVMKEWLITYPEEVNKGTAREGPVGGRRCHVTLSNPKHAMR